jgi:hypothetical protein
VGRGYVFESITVYRPDAGSVHQNIAYNVPFIRNNENVLLPPGMIKADDGLMTPFAACLTVMG